MYECGTRTICNWNWMFCPRKPSSTVKLRGGLNGHGFGEIKGDVIGGG